MLDYLWASLPTVATAGDALADLIESRQLGLTVPAGDVDALEAALERILADDDAAGRHGRGRRSDGHRADVAQGARSRWCEFCRRPKRAPDLLVPAVTAGLRHDLSEVKERWRGLAYDLKTAADHLREGGPLLAARKAAGRARRVANTWRDRDPA